MPGGNRKGPENEGPKTGRGLGYCAGNDHPGYEHDQKPRGIRAGNGLGRGRRFEDDPDIGRGRGGGRGMGQGGGRGRGRGRGRGMGRGAGNL